MARMYDWMAADLSAATSRRASMPWVLAAGHRPMYCVWANAQGRCNEEHEASRRGIPSVCPFNNPRGCHPVAGGSGRAFDVEALLFEAGVDLAVSAGVVVWCGLGSGGEWWGGVGWVSGTGPQLLLLAPPSQPGQIPCPR